MAQNWRHLFLRTSPDQRLMMSVCCPTLERDVTFFDIRRSFAKEGATIPTKNGLRFKIAYDELVLLVNRLELLLLGIQRYSELEGKLTLQRGGGVLMIQRLPAETGPLMKLIPTEAKFLFECLREVIANWVTINAEEEEEEEAASMQMIEHAESWL